MKLNFLTRTGNINPPHRLLACAGMLAHAAATWTAWAAVLLALADTGLDVGWFRKIFWLNGGHFIKL
jgi:hypothetical protein